MGPVSYTQVSLFAACPARYKAERIDGMRGEESLPMRQGSFAHHVLEVYGKRVLADGGMSRPELLRPIFEDAWPTAGLPEIVRMETLRLCEEAARQVVLHKENVAGLESKLAVDEGGEMVDYDSPRAAVRGRIDVLAVQETTQGVALEVVDYKTGRIIVRISEDKQLPLYLALARAVVPQATTFIGKLCYPRHKALRVHEFGAEDLDAVLRWALDIRARIFKAKDEDRFQATPGAACADCPAFWKCEAREKLSAQAVQVPTNDQEAADLVVRAGILDRELGALREALKGFIEANGPISAGGLVADIAAVRRGDYPLADLQGVLARHGLEPTRYLKADSKALKKAVVRYPGLGDDLQGIYQDKTYSKLNIRRLGIESKGEDHEDQ